MRIRIPFRRKKKSILRKIIKRTLIAFFFLYLIFLGAAIGYGYAMGEWFYDNIYLTVPERLELNLDTLQQSSRYYDANDEVLYQEFHDVDRIIVKYNDFPQFLIDAVISIEDKDYFKHKGISEKGILRALYNNYIVHVRPIQGGSTITQQLVKNIYLSPEQSIDRKLKEIVYAIRLEQQFSKEEILEYYLNTVSFGGTAYGIEAASQMYFGKNTVDLNLSEAALLAGLPAAPTKYSPYSDYDKAKWRQRMVFFSMVENNKLEWPQVKEGYFRKLKFQTPKTAIGQPHFVFYTQKFIADELGEDLLQKGGLNIYTSINPTIQRIAQQAINQELPNLKGLNISNAASLITNNRTGEIYAMVGSKDYYDTEIDGYVNLTNSFRQPGSSIKPLNYALYLQNNHTLSSIINDSKKTFKISDKEEYTPENYDSKYRGRVTARRALANSLNVPAVKVLEQNGIEEFANFVTTFGIDPWPKESYGLALTLGSGEVRMIKMNQAYSTFANRGKNVTVSPIRYIITDTNEVLYYNPCIYTKEYFTDSAVVYDAPECSRQTVGEDIAFLIKSVLIDQKTRSEAFGRENVLNVDGAAAKTGTTNNLRDNWTFGFNNQYTVGVWVGNNDNSPMSEVASGVTGAAPIWNKIISQLTNSHNAIDLEEEMPENIHKVKVCARANLLPCNSCPGTDEYYIKGTEPQLYCLDPKPEEDEGDDGDENNDEEE